MRDKALESQGEHSAGGRGNGGDAHVCAPDGCSIRAGFNSSPRQDTR